MYTFLLVLLILVSVVLVGAILLQSGKGSGLAASFGGVSSSADSLLGTRQAGNLLTKTSWGAGAAFLFLSLVLSIISSRQRAPKSVLDQAFTQPAPVTTPAAPGAGGAAGVPLTPVTPDAAAPGSAAPSGSAPAGQAAPATPAPATPAPAQP